MKIEEEIIENRGKIKINELKFKALINLLSNEGLLTKEDIDREYSRLLQEDD
jgi:hypothetical protein